MHDSATTQLQPKNVLSQHPTRYAMYARTFETKSSSSHESLTFSKASYWVGTGFGAQPEPDPDPEPESMASAMSLGMMLWYIMGAGAGALEGPLA